MKDSVAITVWSALPLIATCLAVHSEGWPALVLGIIPAIALVAAFLSRSTSGAHQTIAAALLLFVSAPFAVDVLDSLATARCTLAVADSPAGFVSHTVVEGLLSVPPIVLALGVWRRRGAVVKLPPHA